MEPAACGSYGTPADKLTRNLLWQGTGVAGGRLYMARRYRALERTEHQANNTLSALDSMVRNAPGATLHAPWRMRGCPVTRQMYPTAFQSS